MTSVRSTIPAAVFLALIGFAGLAYLFVDALPTLGARWLFFFLGVLAVTGVFLPVAAFLNLRFPTEPPANLNAILRESLWVGIYVAMLAWLQLGRVLTPLLSLLIFVGLALVEFLIRLREKSRWQP